MEGGRGGARAGAVKRGVAAMKIAAGRGVGAAAFRIRGGSGRAAANDSRQAAHFAPPIPWSPPLPEFAPSTPMDIVCGPSVEQITIGWPDVEAASAANGIRLPNTMANVAARKANERAIDQSSAWERVTRDA